MRILLVCHQFFPRYQTGTETLTLEAGEELRRRGHEVAILTAEPFDKEKDRAANWPEQGEWVEDSYGNLTVYRLKAPVPQNPVERLSRESAELGMGVLYKEILDVWQPDVVHFFHLMRLTGELVKEVKRRRIPCYLTVTDFWLLCPKYQLLQPDEGICPGPEGTRCFSCLSRYQSGETEGAEKWKFRLAAQFPRLACYASSQAAACRQLLAERLELNRQAFFAMDGIVWANEFARKIFAVHGFTHSFQQVVPFPLPNQAANLRNLSFPSGSGILKVAFIGTFRRSKGPHVLVQAARRLAEKANIEFDLWGGFGPSAYERSLRNMAKELTRVNFCGTFSQESFAQVLSEVHVVVIPSLWYENSPLTAIAALAAKRVLIVSDLGGMANMVENEVSGFTFPPGDDRALAELLRRLADDLSQAEKISKAVPSTLSTEEYVEAMCRIYGIGASEQAQI